MEMEIFNTLMKCLGMGTMDFVGILTAINEFWVIGMLIPWKNADCSVIAFLLVLGFNMGEVATTKTAIYITKQTKLLIIHTP